MFWQQNNFITGQIYCNEEVNILEICFKWNHLKGVQGNVSVLFNKGKHFDGNVSNMGKYFELRLEAGANRNLAELSIWHIWIICTTRGGGDHYWLYPTWHSTSSDLPGKQCYQNMDKSFILNFKIKKAPKTFSKKTAHSRLYKYFTKHTKIHLNIGFQPPPPCQGLRAPFGRSARKIHDVWRLKICCKSSRESLSHRIRVLS